MPAAAEAKLTPPRILAPDVVGSAKDGGEGTPNKSPEINR